MSGVDANDCLRLVEALLFASDEPVDPAALKERLPEEVELEELLAELRQHYAERGVNLVHVGGKWTFRTAPDVAPKLKVEAKVHRKLSRAAVETLAIIAYHQPVTRAEIEEIRGVGQSRGTLDMLLEAGWIKPGRRRRIPGRPVTWLTTDKFLEHFGLSGLDELPGVDELKAAGLLETRPAVSLLRERGELMPLGSGDDLDGGAAGGADGEGGGADETFDATDLQSSLVEGEDR